MAGCKSAFYHGRKGKGLTGQFPSLRSRPLKQLLSYWQFLFCSVTSSQPANFIEKWNWIETCKKQARRNRKSWICTYCGWEEDLVIDMTGNTERAIDPCKDQCTTRRMENWSKKIRVSTVTPESRDKKIFKYCCNGVVYIAFKKKSGRPLVQA